jgi:hypothetical protein
MRAIFNHLAWGLATIALVVATPIQAAAGSRTAAPVSASAPAAMSGSGHALDTHGMSAITTQAAVSNTFAAAALQQQDTGQGWAELYCMACVGLGALALYSGGITMLPVILSNPATFGTLAGTCLLACESAIEKLLK